MSDIYLTRGDTENIKIRFLKNKREFTPNDISDGDIFTLTIRGTYNKRQILKKQIIYPEDTFKILHADTKDLEIGRYAYDIEFRKPDDSIVKTLIVGVFELGDEQTYGDTP